MTGQDSPSESQVIVTVTLFHTEEGRSDTPTFYFEFLMSEGEANNLITALAECMEDWTRYLISVKGGV